MRRFVLQSRTLVAACLLAAGTLASITTTAHAQVGTAITYQGLLERNNVKVNTATDMRFTLFDAATGGAAVGQVTLNAQQVSNGLFNVELDFGNTPNPFAANAARWMQIEVRNPAGTGDFSPMGARQKVTPAPFSLATRGINVDGSGNVGVGTPTPDTAKLHVNQGAGGTIGAFSVADAGGYTRLELGLSQGNRGVGRIQIHSPGQGYNDLLLNPSGGNVGIGTPTPTQALHVAGNILATGTITPSCAKLKENVVPMSDALDRIAGLDAVRFDWIADEAKTRGFTHDLGFIAEDVAKAFPEIVFRDRSGEIMGLDYSRMSAVAVGAIKQLKNENDKMKADNEALKARLEKIEALLSQNAGSK